LTTILPSHPPQGFVPSLLTCGRVPLYPQPFLEACRRNFNFFEVRKITQFVTLLKGC
jgi:hypothetical protein